MKKEIFGTIKITKYEIWAAQLNAHFRGAGKACAEMVERHIKKERKKSVSMFKADLNKNLKNN